MRLAFAALALPILLTSYAAARARFAHFADDEPSGVVDHDNPPMTDAELARFRPAADVHSELVAASIRRKGGRPKSPAPKVMVSIRLDPDVIEALRLSGEGWQGRTNEMLRKGLGLDA